MNNSNNFDNEKITGIILDVLISILIAGPFTLIDYRAALSVAAICTIILISRRFI